MSTTLSITNKLISLRGSMQVTDELGSLLYEAKGEFALLSPTWRITRRDQVVATVCKKNFSLTSTWIVQCGLETFQIKRKLFSWTRKYYVYGGSYDGATVEGNFWDVNFKVIRESVDIAVATGKILSLRDRHNIEVVGNGKQDVLFSAISMVVLHLDRSEARRDSD